MPLEPLTILTAQLARLPGVGLKSAQRLAFHILDMPDTNARELAASIVRARDEISFCPICGGYTDIKPCALCADEKRHTGILCVLRDARDVQSMEKMREYHGLYHVLGGAISPMDGVGPDDIRIKELMDRVDAGGIKEVILATNPDVEGEATAVYISKLLKQKGVRVTRIAHGIPIGGNLEYIDEMTLVKAFEGRREM